jgi:hypothetical protein
MSDIVEDLRLLQSGAQWACGQTAATLEDAADEIERLRHDLTIVRLDRDHAQRLVNEARGERDEAVATLALYRAENGCTRGQRTTQWCGEATKLRERLLQVNAGLLRVLQYEKKCDQTGKPCDASRGCACSLEAETWCDGDGT